MAFLCAVVSLGNKTPVLLFFDTISNTDFKCGCAVLMPTCDLALKQAKIKDKKNSDFAIIVFLNLMNTFLKHFFPYKKLHDKCYYNDVYSRRGFTYISLFMGQIYSQKPVCKE